VKDTDLYQQVLGLDKPWQVREVKLELAAKRVTVIIECDRGVRWGDPADGSRAHIQGWTKRQWRHLDTCQFETVLEAEVPSVKYADGRVEEVAVPWAERYSRVSKLMQAFVIRVLEAASSVQEEATLLGMGWEQVNRIMKRAVERGLQRREASEIEYLGIDEPERSGDSQPQGERSEAKEHRPQTQVCHRAQRPERFTCVGSRRGAQAGGC